MFVKTCTIPIKWQLPSYPITRVHSYPTTSVPVSRNKRTPLLKQLLRERLFVEVTMLGITEGIAL
jgi:hypothetical protein